MSGGHWDYIQYRIEEASNDVKEIIVKNGSTELDEYGWNRNRNYSKETIDEYKKGRMILKLAAIYLNRMDWLESGDDGEEEFMSRLKSDLEESGFEFPLDL